MPLVLSDIAKFYPKSSALLRPSVTSIQIIEMIPLSNPVWAFISQKQFQRSQKFRIIKGGLYLHIS